VVAAVLLVDVLDDFFTTFVFEVDVDIGRLVALFADESLEEHADASGIDRGDAKAETDGGIGGCAAALAEDAACASKGDKIVDGEEVGRVAEIVDETQFVLELRVHTGGDALGIAFGCAGEGELAQVVHGRGAQGHDFVWILVAELIEGEADTALGNGESARDGVGIGREETGHFFGGLEMTLGVGVQPVPSFIDRAALADAGEHILQGATLGRVVVHIVGHDERHFCELRERCDLLDACCVGRVVRAGESEGEAILSEDALQACEQVHAGFVERGRRQECGHEAAVVCEHVVQRKVAVGFGSASLAQGEQLAEVGVAVAVHDVQ
jgi:hypothetical protein